MQLSSKQRREPIGWEAAKQVSEDFIREKFEDLERRREIAETKEKLDWLWGLRKE